MYDTTEAGYARWRAYDAESYGDHIRAQAWRDESWRLWNGISTLHIDPTGSAYDVSGYPHWMSYPDQYYIDQENEIIALLHAAEAEERLAAYIWGFTS